MLADPAKQQQFLKGILSPFPKTLQTFILTTMAEFLEHVRRIMSSPSLSERIRTTLASLWLLIVTLVWSIGTTVFRFGVETAKRLFPRIMAQLSAWFSSLWFKVKEFGLERQEWVLTRTKEGFVDFRIRAGEQFKSRMYSLRDMLRSLLMFPLELLEWGIQKIASLLSPILEQLESRFHSFRLVVQDFLKIPMELFARPIQLVSSFVSQLLVELQFRLHSLRVMIGDFVQSFIKQAQDAVAFARRTIRKLVDFNIQLSKYILTEFKDMITSPLQYLTRKVYKFLGFLPRLPELIGAFILGCLYSALALGTWAAQKAFYVAELLVSCYMAAFVGAWYLITDIKRIVRDAITWVRELVIGIVTAFGALLFVSGSFLLFKIRRFIAPEKGPGFDDDRLQNGAGTGFGDDRNGWAKTDDPTFRKDTALEAIQEEIQPLYM